MKFANNQPPRAEFQIAPMIDIVFLLLIFFIVTWNISNQDVKPNKEISLPSSEEGKTTKSYDNGIVINITKDGIIKIGEKVYTKESITAHMKFAHRLYAEKPITIWADKQATVEQAFSIFNICKAAGFSTVNMAAQPYN